MGNRFLDWCSSTGEGISFGFALTCFIFFHSFLGNCERWTDDLCCSFWERYLEFFCNFFSFAMISLMVGVLHFEEVKVLWILFSIFLGNLGKLVIFHFVEVEIFLLKLVFSFLSFLFLCSLGNYGILESWWLKLFILREKIDILVCFFELYILYFWNKLITSSFKLLF